MNSSCFPSFHKLSMQERVRTVRDRGLLSLQEYKAPVNGETTLDFKDADGVIEARRGAGYQATEVRVG